MTRAFTISDGSRRRFEMIGEDRIAAALGAGEFPSLGLPENMKPQANIAKQLMRLLLLRLRLRLRRST